MKIYKINNKNQKQIFQNLGCDIGGVNILFDKANLNLIYIKDISSTAANILKQDALSIGADLAVPKNTILLQTKKVDAILIASNKHLKILSKKELSQPFGLKELATKISQLISKPTKYDTQIMGVINANDDSFYNKSRFKSKKAIKQIYKMIDEKANIIDIGAVSSRPGSNGVTPKEELKRIKNICDTIKKEKLYKKVTFSIDSYTPSVVEYALKSGFKIINDITGLKDNKIAKLASKYGATVVIMHMQGTPKDMQLDPKYDDVIYDIDKFFQKRIKKAKKFGIENIILDVGIGFGKTLEHNLLLLKHLEHFNHFGYQVLVGASRKSLIDKIVPSDVKDRLSGTLAIHLDAISKGASIIRCHDVKEHYMAIKIQEAIIN
jgi:dihydropteroate synthase